MRMCAAAKPLLHFFPFLVFFTVLGHTAVYHSSLNVVLVYGGFGYHPNGSTPSVSKAMLQINLTHWHCSVLEPDRERAPSPVVSDVIRRQ